MIIAISMALNILAIIILAVYTVRIRRLNQDTRTKILKIRGRSK